MTNEERRTEGRAIANELSLLAARLQKQESNMQAKLQRRGGTKLELELENWSDATALVMDAVNVLDETYGRDDRRST